MLGVILDKMLRFNLLFLAGIERLVQRKSYLVTSKHSVFQKWQSSINNFFKCKREKVIENKKDKSSQSSYVSLNKKEKEFIDSCY